MYYIVGNYIFDKNYRENFGLADGPTRLNYNLFQLIKYIFTGQIWLFDYILIFGTGLFQVILPGIVSIAGLNFYGKLHTINKTTAYRKKNYANYIANDILLESLKISISVFSAYIAYYLFALYLSGGQLSDYAGRELFLDILGDDFYTKYPYFYYLLDGFVRFFMIPFIYSLYACAISLFANGKKQVFLASNAYYYGLTVVAFGLYMLIGNNAIYLNPTVIMASGAYLDINTILLMSLHMIPIIISYFMIKRHVNHVEL